VAKTTLGKGLDALLEEAGASDFFDQSPAMPAHSLPAGMEQTSAGAFVVDIDRLKPNPQQPRTDFDEEALGELAASIRENGVIQPVIIEDAGDGSFYIIAGERRTRAARLAGLRQIPAVLKQYSEERKLEIALIENIQRENLNPVEEAQAYEKLMRLRNLTQEETADLVGKKRPTVANALRLLKLPADMRSALAAGKLTAGHARALLSVDNAADQRALFTRILGSGLSVREAEQYAVSLKSKHNAASKTAAMPSAPERDPDFAALEQQFIDALGTKVALKGGFDRGDIQIEFFSKDDLERIYSLIAE
jgi:ParB family chromosome partitioning protein